MCPAETSRSGSATIVFRADAHAAIGGGHVARCLSIASAMQMRGWRCVFVARTGVTSAIPYLGTTGVELIETEPARLADPSSLGDLLHGDVDAVVVDGYGFDARYESACRSWAPLVVAIEDQPDRLHDCDILVDQTPGRNATDYSGSVPCGATVLAGASFTLVSENYAKRRAAALDKRKRGLRASHLVISLGATDPDNLTSRVLAELDCAGWPNLVSVLLSPAAPGIEIVRSQVERMALDVRLHVGLGPAEIAALLADADLAVGASGVNTWERCCLGLPSVMLVVADNQRDIAAALDAAGGAVVLGRPETLDPGTIASTAIALAGDSGRLRAMAENAALICDGAGGDRVALAISEIVERRRVQDGA